MASVGDLLRVVASLALDVGVTFQNVYYLSIIGPADPDTEEVLDDMGEYLEDIYSEINARIPSSIEYVEYEVTDVTVDVSLGTRDWPVLTAGTAGTDFTPAQVAGLVLARTNTPGHHGRKYFPPFHETSLDYGEFVSGAVVDLAEAGEAAFGSFSSTNGFTYMPCVLDRETGTRRSAVEVGATSIPGTQRRRRRGVGI